MTTATTLGQVDSVRLTAIEEEQTDDRRRYWLRDLIVGINGASHRVTLIADNPAALELSQGRSVDWRREDRLWRARLVQDAIQVLGGSEGLAKMLSVNLMDVYQWCATDTDVPDDRIEQIIEIIERPRGSWAALRNVGSLM